MAIVDITDRCNLRCIYCCRGDDVTKHIYEPSVSDLMDVVNQLIHIRGTFIVLQGGEPLLRDDITDIMNKMGNLKTVVPGYYLKRMRQIVKQGYCCEQFAMQYKRALVEQHLPLYFISTNGMIYTDNIRNALYENGFSVDVSLDSVDEEINRKTRIGIDLKRVRETIEKFSQTLPVNLSCTVTEYNVDKLFDMVPFAADYGCISVKYSPVMMIGKRKEDDRLWWEKYLESINHILDKFDPYKEKLFLNIKIYPHYLNSEMGKSTYQRILSSPNVLLELHECAAFRKIKEVYVDTKLNVYGCASMKNDERLVMGNLREYTLKELWDMQKRKDFKKDIAQYYEKAAACGGCTGAAYVNR